MKIYQLQIIKTVEDGHETIKTTNMFEMDIEDEEMIAKFNLDNPHNLVVVAMPTKDIISVLSSSDITLSHYIHGFHDCIGMARDWDSYFPEQKDVE